MRPRTPLASMLILILAIAAFGCGGAAEQSAAPDDTGASEAASPADAPDPAANLPDTVEPATEAAPETASEPAAEPASEAADPTAALLDPTSPTVNRRAPEEFRAAFDTTRGRFVVEVHRAWAPRGADRFYNLVRSGYYDGNRFFRVVEGFVAQFGMNGDPAVNEAWDDAAIEDDPMGEMNTRGRLTFAHAGPGTRTTQLFINLGDNLNLDNQGFPPFGEIVEGMDVVDGLYAGYGDGPPYGVGPDQGRIGAEGTAYLEREFPLLDHVESARVIAER